MLINYELKTSFNPIIDSKTTNPRYDTSFSSYPENIFLHEFNFLFEIVIIGELFQYFTTLPEIFYSV